MIDMRPRFLRVLCAGITAAVAVLVLLCVMLVHHGGEAGAPAPAVHTVQPGGGGHGSSVPHEAPDDHCSVTDLVACVRTSSGAMTSLVVLLLGALALAFVTATGRRLRLVCLAAGPPSTAPPPAHTAPLLALLCISRT